ncbi:4'-phosphopantetheinyl transferase superfamily protein [Sphingobacterium sp. DN00404]|uniref:4'-phosphopantetheinyl transferase superfamily protein n=1 Tax=Sphingobacterium micropteri TaxID=2763501 RepID=A0ABR7YKZ3_9SPHI|nr:4'-phosphopantetheinyl transferase superfamily protein [Sphingobacterium micropteri]MBD1431901.1 4'-phosphopantetheinyl transferase superfamily protein [Sphingobacterium micropteri]
MALVYLRELDAETKFAIWKIEETATELLDRLQLDEREKSLLERFSKGKRTLHWLASRVLLRYLLKTDAFIACPSDANGKPYLPDYPYQISFTHSYDYAGLMMSQKGPCGIDLEIVKDKVVRIKEKFMKPNELAFIQNDNIEQLYACWCAKEAVYKLQGNKGISFLENMTILPFQYKPQGVMTVMLRKGSTVKSFPVYYEKFQDYMLGYVVDEH